MFWFAICAIFSITYYGCLGIDMRGCSEPYIIDSETNISGDLYSPGFEENLYPDELRCVYTIYAPPESRIKLTFKELDIEPLDMCRKDMLFMYDGPDRRRSPLLGVICGTEPPAPIISPSNVITIFFVSDFLGGRKGFHIHYEMSENFNGACPEGYKECRNRKCYHDTDRCNGKDECGDGTDEEECYLPVPGVKCGDNPITPYNFDINGFDKIVGGRQAKPGSWPWQVDLQRGVYYPNGHVCGGTLIAPQWVLTAMHCVQGKPDVKIWRVHLGNHHKYLKDDHEQVRYVERIIIYPEYTGDDLKGKSFSMENDMALMKLSSPVIITDYVRPVCLPPQGFELPLNTRCISTGWGATRGSGSEEVLKQVELFTISECPNTDTMICVKHPGGLHDVCSGDSGGPMVTKINNVWTLVGVTSFGTKTNFIGKALCAMEVSTSSFSKVSQKVTWIYEMIDRYT